MLAGSMHDLRECELHLKAPLLYIASIVHPHGNDPRYSNSDYIDQKSRDRKQHNIALYCFSTVVRTKSARTEAVMVSSGYHTRVIEV